MACGLPSGQTLDEIYASILPQNVSVIFPACSQGQCLDPYEITIPLSTFYDEPVGHPVTKIYHDTAIADFANPDDAQPSNQALLMCLATQIAYDTYLFQQSTLDITYNGIINWVPESVDDKIEITYTDNCVETNILRPAWNWYVEELMHDTGVTTSCTLSQEIVTAVTCINGVLQVTTKYINIPCGLGITISDSPGG